jgi:hypothetical protein
MRVISRKGGERSNRTEEDTRGINLEGAVAPGSWLWARDGKAVANTANARATGVNDRLDMDPPLGGYMGEQLESTPRRRRSQEVSRIDSD